MIRIKSSGGFPKTEKFFKNLLKVPKLSIFDKYGQAGVDALASATPVDSGKTAQSWRYVVTQTDGQTKVEFVNDNVNKGVNIAVILQYGHGTRNGGWVEGRDYINPAIRSIFDQLAEDAWEEVKRA